MTYYAKVVVTENKSRQVLFEHTVHEAIIKLSDMALRSTNSQTVKFHQKIVHGIAQ